ncbi:MAG: hypothetical protein CMF59_08430 [Leptospiraceae bacterium]|nr:hypothetical protein [Leptospiraceae bacterium]
MFNRMKMILLAFPLVAVMNCTPTENLTGAHLELTAITAILAENNEPYSLIRVHNSSLAASGYEFYLGTGCGALSVLSIPSVPPDATSDYYTSTSSIIGSVQRVTGGSCYALDPPLTPGNFRSLYDSGDRIRVL